MSVCLAEAEKKLLMSRRFAKICAHENAAVSKLKQWAHKSPKENSKYCAGACKEEVESNRIALSTRRCCREQAERFNNFAINTNI